jgi:WW domain-containing oxidoreductase
LPLGWEKTILDDGKIIYVDHQNRRTTYSDPRLAFAKEETTTNVRQKFDSSTTALQVLHGKDLRGKTAVITGANCGIGRNHLTFVA